MPPFLTVVTSPDDPDLVLAIILHKHEIQPGIQFYTPDNFSQQLGTMNRPAGYSIPPHVHLPVSRSIEFTKEVLFIQSGCVRVDFYSDDQSYISSNLLHEGDTILLAHGGHGFQVLADAQIIEIKQGPYAGTKDKLRFDPVPNSQVKLPSPSTTRAEQTD